VAYKIAPRHNSAPYKLGADVNGTDLSMVG